jgi:glycosyltransferase involved in cell wall biosynthesis
LVSVIVPTYNRASLLRQTIESVLAQTYPNIELIVVDDGSTDAIATMLREYEGRLVNLRKVNGGGTAARNSGIAAARGEYLNFLDHDDLLLPTKIEKQVAILQSRPEVGLVHCGYYRMDKDGQYIDIVNYLPEGDVRPVIVLGCFCWSGGPLIRRACIDQVGVFDESVWSSDADMWLKIALAGYHFGCVQEPLGAYLILNDSSMADVERTERMDMQILDRVFARKDLPPEAVARRDEGYFNQRFWLACRYYTLGKWDDAKRNLRESLRLRPEVMTDGMALVNLFCTNALDPAWPIRWAGWIRSATTLSRNSKRSCCRSGTCSRAGY